MAELLGQYVEEVANLVVVETCVGSSLDEDIEELSEALDVVWAEFLLLQDGKGRHSLAVVFDDMMLEVVEVGEAFLETDWW